MSDIVKAKLTTVDKDYIRTTVDISRPASETIVLRGKFKHVGHPANHAVYTAISEDKPITSDGLLASMSPLPTVISNQPGENPTVIDVSDGDVIEVDGTLYRIADDRPLNYPRLVKLDVDVDGFNLFSDQVEEVDNPGEMVFDGGNSPALDADPDDDPEFYGPGKVIIGHGADTGILTVWWDSVDERNCYGVHILTDQFEYKSVDVYSPDDGVIDVEAARKNVLAMLYHEAAEATEPSGTWSQDVVNWAHRNLADIRKNWAAA